VCRQSESPFPLPTGRPPRRISSPTREESEFRKHWRSPFLAGLLSLLFPPLGNVYAGQAWRGFRLSIAFMAVSMLFRSLAFQTFGVAWFLLSILLLPIGIVVLIVDAVRAARLQGSGFRLKRYNRWYVYLATVVLLAGINTIFMDVLAPLPRAYSIYGTDMDPTLVHGDCILVDQQVLRSRPPHRGEIVVFRPPHRPDTPYVKRVIGLPGEVLEIRDSQVYIDGKRLNEPYLQRVWQDNRPAERVPEGHLYVMGDNRDNSSDSRSWGALPRDQVSDVVRTVYFSWDSATSSVRWQRIGRTVSRGAVTRTPYGDQAVRAADLAGEQDYAH
jgi:signal peptidase I